MTSVTPAAIVTEARSWLGTPYHHHAQIKGVGVDCARLLCAVFGSIGAVPPVDPGFYPHDWHLHRNAELFIEWMGKYGRRLGDDEALQPGDVALFRYGRTYSHGAIMMDADRRGWCIHSQMPVGVILSRLDEEPLASRAVQFWRVAG